MTILDSSEPNVVRAPIGTSRLSLGWLRSRGFGPLFWLTVGWLTVVVVAATLAEWLPLPDPNAIDVAGRLAPPLSPGHVLGTDGTGRDVLARIVFGMRTSLIVATTAVVIGLAIGGLIGTVIGYVRGRVDTIVVAGLDVILAFPALILLLALVAFAGRNLATIIVGIGLLYIPGFARVARANTMALSEREYVLAATALGATAWRVLFAELLPGVGRSLMAFALLLFGSTIIIEGSLAFLGLSVPPPAPTLGGMIADGRRFLGEAPWLTLIPSTVLALTVISFNYVGDAIRRRTDVRRASR
jgi:peptide/nickel transport system permease protein